MKVIDWTPFYNNNIWHENVVAIGLSAGFIEPLESTGIALIMEGIYQLALRILEYHWDYRDIDLYNATMKYFFEESINFVSMHYSNTQRSEPFWKIVKDTIKISDQQKLYQEHLADSEMPFIRRPDPRNFFTGHNWNTWLIQMGHPVAPRSVDKKESQKCLDFNFEKEQSRKNSGVLHSSYIDSLSAKIYIN